MERTLVQSGGWNGRGIVGIVVLVASIGAVSVTTDFGLAATVTGVLGLAFLYWGVRSATKALASRGIERAAIGPLGSHAGPVAVEGTGRVVDEPITAPMTGSESIAYRVEVSQWEPTSDHSD